MQTSCTAVMEISFYKCRLNKLREQGSNYLYNLSEFSSSSTSSTLPTASFAFEKVSARALPPLVAVVSAACGFALTFFALAGF